MGYVTGLILSFIVRTKTYDPADASKDSEIFIILNGKLKNRYFNLFEHNFLSIINNSGKFSTKAQTKSFLTTAPIEKITDVNIPEYLYFLTNIQDCPSEINLKAIITYTDQTTEVIVLEQLTEIVMNNILLFNVSASLIISKANSLKEVFEYAIYLTDNQGNIISEKRVYIIDPQTHELTYNLLFRNNLGTFDTLRCTGERDEYLDFQVDSIETQSTVIDYYSEAVTKLNFRTGNLAANWLTYLVEELTASKEIYWLRGIERIRLAHAGKSLKTYDPTKTQDTAIFEFRIAQTEVNQ